MFDYQYQYNHKTDLHKVVKFYQQCQCYIILEYGHGTIPFHYITKAVRITEVFAMPSNIIYPCPYYYHEQVSLRWP